MNYANIAKALDFYQERGYVYVEDAAWVVDKPAYYLTKPEGAQADIIRAREDGTGESYLVASGEQSFIQMMMEGQPIKRAICVTPCFRVDKYDALRRPYFLKAELINAQDVDEGHLIHMIHDACSFFEQFFSVRVVKTDIGYDIVEKGTRIELGSYGIRDLWYGTDKNGKFFVGPADVTIYKYDGLKRLQWIYGTACAEPRLSTAIARHSKLVGK